MRRSYALWRDLANPMSHKEQNVCLCGDFRALALRTPKIENAYEVPRRVVFHFAAAGREHLLVAKLCSQ
jgi:hypothetical protein